jgi:hypothetical protein
MNPKKENKEREQSPRRTQKRKEKLLPFEQFKDIDWKIFMPVEEKIKVGKE